MTRRGAPKVGGLLLLACLCLLPAGCGPSNVRYEAAPIDSLGAWSVDWDQRRGLDEISANPGLFDRISVFAAYFDGEGNLFLAPEWVRALSDPAAPPRSLGVPLYLCVVNDRVAKGAEKRKDPALVNRFLGDPAARAEHVRQILALAEGRGFSGVELDYENVLEADWPRYLAFLPELRDALAARGLSLSVVLEPKRRYLGHALPQGIDYTVMGYNLFGSHSGPGPKATPTFLASLAASLRAIGGLDRCALALATGGFDWREGKAVKSLTESDAERLARSVGCSPGRDPESGYRTCSYDDAQGRRHEVWYADGATFATLWDAARTAGFRKLYVWRLGGNEPDLFTMLKGGKKK
ncbi:hypothetical protein [Desulfovibrio sp. X2]|uniref:hypothetical protein n=1 Tax=Desulfovibrio sp. X2 TaxID=941449 RepID=UPI00041A9035|nr:hypothetical protein [Desulfovibrio sp. X2]